MQAHFGVLHLDNNETRIVLKGHGLLFYETQWSWNKMVQPPVSDKNCTVEKLIK